MSQQFEPPSDAEDNNAPKPSSNSEENNTSQPSYALLPDVKTMAIVGTREVLGIGYKDADRVSYAESGVICQTLLPGLFTDDTAINTSQVSEDIQVALYEQRADAQRRIRGDGNITAFTLIDEDIVAKEREIEANPDGKVLKSERKKLLRIRQKLKKEKYTEREVMERDVYQVKRDLPISGQGRGYIEFRLPHNRALRIRLFHPDTPEKLTGVEVVYEHLSDEEELVRIVAMQYKMVEHNVLAMPSKKELDRFEKQLVKMQAAFCNGSPSPSTSPSYCEPSPQGDTERWLCRRYCSAFLRPTERTQNPDARYISTGYHVPSCRFRELWNTSTSKRLPVQSFSKQSIKSEVFEELFNLNEIGSRWLTYQELEVFYKKNKVLEPDDRIVIHAQEFAR